MLSCAIVVVEVRVMESKRDSIQIDQEDNVTTYYKIRQQLNKLEGDMQVGVRVKWH